jgi:hypothetical protein
MKGAFIFGLLIAVFGILVSLLSNVWEVAFVISSAVGGITIVISSGIKRAAQIQQSKNKINNKTKVGDQLTSDEDEYWIKAFSLFALPNIIVAVVLYFIIYL